MPIVLATSNQHKIQEINQIVDGKIQFLSLKDIDCFDELPETSDTIEGNALQKAQFVFQKYNIDVVAEDTGLEVYSLDNQPGVKTARYAGEPPSNERNIDLLLQNLTHSQDRKARFKTVFALIKNGKPFLFEGICEGEIATQKSGTNGFGYDPIFIPDGYAETMAELGTDIKNQISHRAKGLQKLIQFLTENKDA